MDKLKHVIWGENYEVTKGFIIRNPTLLEVVEFGEEEYLYLVQILLSKPQDMMVFFDDMGIDFETIDEFQFALNNFLSAPKTIAQMRKNKDISNNTNMEPSDEIKSSVCILFGEIDISTFQIVEDAETKDVALYHKDKDLLLSKSQFFEILDFIRRTNNIKDSKKRNFASDFVKKEVIEFERMKMRRRQRENKEFESMMSNIISRLVNTSGFKYDYASIFKLKISQFYDALVQLQSISEYEHLMRGIYAGTVQYDKLSDKSVLNWINTGR